MNDLLEDLEDLQQIYIGRATQGRAAYDRFEGLRRDLLAHSTVGKLLPSFVREYRYLDQFWEHIKRYAPSYAERRDYIWQAFRPALDRAEAPAEHHVDSVASTLSDLSAAHIHEAWATAIDRRETDPAGAITAARSLLESVCKLILDEAGIAYRSADDLPKLYRAVSERLTLAPSQHSEDVFKRVLGGCQSVVEGLGSIRNKLGDAHGQGKRPIRPAARHAELVVNLAGGMAVFLAATWRHTQHNAT